MVARLIKLIISIFFWFLDTIILKGGEYPGIILLYHNVKKKDRGRFKKQLDVLLNTSTPVFADTVCNNKKKRYISITFDDAFCGAIENGISETIARDIPVTLFVPTGYLNQYPMWYKDCNGFSEEDKIIDEKKLINLSKNELVKIGSHTVTHPIFDNINNSEIKKEINNSKIYLEKLICSEITNFSFPYGIYNESILELCKSAGYQYTFSVLPKSVMYNNNEYLRGRIDVEPTDWIIEFKLKIMGAYRWLPYAFKIKRFFWEIFK